MAKTIIETRRMSETEIDRHTGFKVTFTKTAERYSADYYGKTHEYLTLRHFRNGQLLDASDAPFNDKAMQSQWESFAK